MSSFSRGGFSTRTLLTVTLLALGCQRLAQSQITSFPATAHRRAAEPGSQSLFANAVIYGSGAIGGSGGVAVADVNGDGRPDLAITNPTSGNVGVLLGNGDGTFQTAVTYDSGGDATSVVLADVNGDGNPDMLVTHEGADSVGVLLGNGDGTFRTALTYGSGGSAPSGLAVADVNADGKPDLLVANLCSGNGCLGNGSVGVLLGNGDGTFQTAITYPSNGYLTNWVVVADVNGDSKRDLLVANGYGDSGLSNGSVGVLLGNGDGTFQTAVTYTLAGQPISVAVADFNGDGKPDLAVASNGSDNVSVLLGNGDGTFQSAVSYGAGANAVSVAVGDFNGDGQSDLAVANSGANNVSVLLGSGDGTFQTAVNYASGAYAPGSVVAVDLNGDGKPDLAVGNECSGPCLGQDTGAVGVLINISLPYTTTLLGSSINPSDFGQAVSFTATVNSHGKGTPAGTVTFFDGATNLGSSSLDGSGVAALTIATLAVGTHSIVAGYNGDASLAPSNSSVSLEVIRDAAPGTISIAPASGSPTSAEVAPGKAALFTLMITPSGNFNATVHVACGVTPAVMLAPTCTVPATVQVSGGKPVNVPVTVQTAASGSAGTVAHGNFPPAAIPIAWMVFLFASASLPIRNCRRWPALASAVLVLAFIPLAGCGGSRSASSSGTPANTYSVTVTAASGDATSKTTLTVIVQ
jgi:hypothetical protein